METRVIAGQIAGTSVGAIQTPLIRELVDRPNPTLGVEALGGFGTPSALLGLITGALTLGAAAYGASKGRDGRQRMKDEIVMALAGHGTVAVESGLLSGIYPAVTEADCTKAGKYWYDGWCHEKPKAGATSLEPQVTKSYVPATVQQPSLDINVLKQMSAEIQRLAQENQQFRAQVQAQAQAAQAKAQEPPAIIVQPLPGPVAEKQKRYGFMETETAQPIKRVEQIRKRYDFMG